MARPVVLSLDDEEPAEAEQSGKQIEEQYQDDRPNPNVGQFSAALGCYPIISQLVRYLDLNSLHDLSRTCRQVRVNLLQHQKLLVSQTLRCDNENANPAERLGAALHASHQVWTAYGRDGTKIGRITSGKIGACAADLVGECRRCGSIVCRNCVIKAPPVSNLKGRHRRLCRTCMKSPMQLLTTVTIPTAQSSHERDANKLPAAGMIARSPCTCDKDGVWICQPCGYSLRPADTTYFRGWAWRTRYRASGGFGAGLGEGNEAVECGRHSDCLAAKGVEQEVECDASDMEALAAEVAKAEVEGHEWRGSSYESQEIMGIGGQVKRKIKKRVLVGAVVKEYEDEQSKGDFCGREQRGENRSWCSWCERVVPGKKDLERTGMSSESVASESSNGSI
ncbi:hypothetical protein EJ03DRAFT_329295 [Teratosphaeria nubilosa]|uniref:F-box domain-containing protein n=1 Tax=Teratosphaeria nubilosa TaxID=161662 RepID=A0A6G1L3F1_9PEZI|nr:hypothetical protein EJ03DRAFT_329295 [Teratosphaeria nubilosa]